VDATGLTTIQRNPVASISAFNYSGRTEQAEIVNSPLFEIARVLVRFDHIALHRKRESQRDVSGCDALRSQLHC
jgi:hypothetical protein